MVTRDTKPIGIMARPRGETAERDLSWLDFSLLTDLSADGAGFSSPSSGRPSEPIYTGFLRRQRTGVPCRRGEDSHRLSRPTEAASSRSSPEAPPHLFLLPTGAGAGQPRPIAPPGTRGDLVGGLVPGRQADRRRRGRARSRRGALRLRSRERPDARDHAARESSSTTTREFRSPRTGSAWRPFSPTAVSRSFQPREARAGPFPNSRPARSRSPGRPMAVALRLSACTESPARILRVEAATGQRESWKDSRYRMPTGVHGYPRFG